SSHATPRPPPRPPLFPYTTLFRSRAELWPPAAATTAQTAPPTASVAATQSAGSRLAGAGCAAVSSIVPVRSNVVLISPLLPSQVDRKSTRLNSSHLGISYAVFCLK